MIIEYTYSPNDLKKKCYGCSWLEFQDPDEWYYGRCKCPHNKIKFRERQINSKACVWKNADKSK
jgi:hypothetical protein